MQKENTIRMQRDFFLNLNDTNLIPCIFTLESRELFYIVNIKRHDVIINVAVFCET